MTQLPSRSNLDFIEELYLQYLGDPNSVDASWRAYFGGLYAEEPPPAGLRLGPRLTAASLFHSPAHVLPAGAGEGRTDSQRDGASAGGGASDQALNGHRAAAQAGLPSRDVAEKQDRVDQLIRAYRVRGHLLAQLDPLGLPRPPQPELETSYYGLGEADLDRRFSSRTIFGTESQTLRQMLERLRATYCRTIGVQFMHIDELHTKNWLMERMEGTENRIKLTKAEQLRILTCLTDAVIFEDYLQKKFLGAKRFSLEGGESLIPLLDMAIEESARHGVREIVFGMAHRGRINVLANILGKPPAEIFSEFEDLHPEENFGRGDVKYHLGYSSDRQTTAGHAVHLTLCFNPSHLEFVNPVALGRLRAKQDRYGDHQRTDGMAILIHGDAAFIGQGVVAETLNLSELEAYATGGTLHVVVNNQVGFTTSPSDARSSTYATDIARLLQVPIFHVNGEDPEAVMQVVRLALQFRAAFKKDVVIDLYCYRRYGHNEGDEPEFTQPLMYRAIKAKQSVREVYLQRLTSLGEITVAEAERIAAERRAVLDQNMAEARRNNFKKSKNTLGGVWLDYRGGRDTEVPRIQAKTEAKELEQLLTRLCQLPQGFSAHPKIERLLAQRLEMARGERPLDWAAAEALAFATLAVEGKPIRMTGQDVERGTFSHRHAVLHDYKTGAEYCPLMHLSAEQGRVEIKNSPLSEVAVMGFEYGYSMDRPAGLTCWEAQFGDFVNVAQVIIDQFIVSAEAKWNRLSGLTLLLPHGFEGQGPEHSSARLERFLALAAEDNIQIVVPTTPAQYFQVLRRQVLRPWRKPLIIMTPKSLLRHPRAVSSLADLTPGHYLRVYPDTGRIRTSDGGEKRVDPQQVERLLLCAGKLYYELEERRDQEGRSDVAILRLEQLYPLAEDDLRHALGPYRPDVPLIWVQEEPRNMGAWPYLQTQGQLHARVLGQHRFLGISRRSAAVPATGSGAAHKLEQKQLIDQAFGPLS
jgi:2-oxoglutarate dehydrogenase E1 component